MARTEFDTDDMALINTIQNALQPEILEVDGRSFTSRPVHDPPAPATAAPLATHTLQSVIDYLEADQKFDHVIPAGKDDPGLAIHVVDATKVEIVRELEERSRKREILIRAQAIEVIGPTFNFARFYPLEQFVIALRSLFAETDDVTALVKILGRVEDSSVRQFDDDGVSQSVIARTGIATKSDVAVPALVLLAPFRTFPEIDQPFSEFFLRLRGGDDEDPPEAALYETDGGKWKIEAIDAIKKFLDGKVGPVPIIA